MGVTPVEEFHVVLFEDEKRGANRVRGEFFVEGGDVRGSVASAAGRGVRGGVQRGEVRHGVHPATVHHGAFEVDGVRGAVYDAGATLEVAATS